MDPWLPIMYKDRLSRSATNHDEMVSSSRTDTLVLSVGGKRRRVEDGKAFQLERTRLGQEGYEITASQPRGFSGRMYNNEPTAGQQCQW